MYKNIHYDKFNNTIHLWDDIEGYCKFEYKPYAYIIDKDGDNITIDGHKVKKVSQWSKSAEEIGLVYEHDVPATIKTLIDLYHDSDDLSTDITVLPLDIEVAKEGSYSTVEEANNTIISISFYNTKEKVYYCLLLDKIRPQSEYSDSFIIDNTDKEIITKYYTFNSEYDLLKVFLREYNLIKPDILTGWNCLSINSTIWLPNKIAKIQNIIDDDILYDSVVNKSMYTGNKEEYSLIDRLGNSLLASENHIIPVYCVPSGKYINNKTIKKYYEELTIKDIKNKLQYNNIYTIQQLGINKNSNLTYKNLIINNFELFCSYDWFDFKLDHNIFRNYIKENPNFYFDSNDLSLNNKFNNKWRYKLCGKFFPNELILDFLNSSNEITFIFGSNKSIKIDISVELSADILQLLGFIFTDGTYSIYDKNYSYCNKEYSIMEGYYNILNTEKLKNPDHGKFKIKKQDGCYYQSFGLNNKFRLLHPFIYHISKKKNLNIELLSQLSQNQFFYFISGAIDGDGSITDCINICNFNNKIENNPRFFIELLRWNSIVCNLQANTTIRIKAVNRNKILYNSVRLFHPKRKEKLQTIKYFDNKNSTNKNCDWFIDNDLLFVKIKSILNTGNVVPMYDLSTSTHFFISNGIKVHNCEWYDMPYLYNRICKVLGKDWVNGLSPIKNCHLRNTGEFNNLRLFIAGISIMDYLTLYKKFTYSEQPNYKLDTIAKKELGRGKVEYDGDLQKLYDTDIKKFAKYNVIDVELIVALDEKLQLLDIARGICHKGHVPYEDFIYPSKYLDGASLVYCKRNNLIASSNKAEKDDSDDTAEGAFVKLPKPGLYKWVIDLDLESLYPGNIRTLNISPETKFARILQYSEEDYAKKVDRKYKIELIKDKSTVGKFTDDGKFTESTIILNGSDQLEQYLQKNNLSLSSNGILYTLDKPGLIPSILTLWFKERKDFQKEKNKYESSGDKDLAQLYDKKQLVTKILLNSFYGVLLLKSFRFYDRENGEAVTVTGKSLIGFSMKAANSLISKEVGVTKDYCIYGDTDSVDGGSYIRVNGIDNKSIEQTFKESKQICRYVIDRNGREFIFPNITLPYFSEGDNQIKLGRVQYIERHLIKKRRFELKTNSGKTIIVTEDHSIMIFRNGQLIEVKPLEIKITDKIISIK